MNDCNRLNNDNGDDDGRNNNNNSINNKMYNVFSPTMIRDDRIVCGNRIRSVVVDTRFH